MPDDQKWLKHPVLPRPPTLPYFGPEFCALVGLEAEDFEAADGGRKQQPRSLPPEPATRRVKSAPEK